MALRAWTPKSLVWQVAERFDNADELARQANTAPLVAQVLVNRGVTTADAAGEFLNPKLTNLHDPSGLAGTVEAADRLARAVRDKEKIVIYGDYDVDGMTAVAILHACLRMLGASADFYVPHRLDEGYGVNVEAVRKIIADGAKLIVTVDCGVSAVEPLAEAVAAGVDVIVTDHHGLPKKLPDVTAIVHPRLPGKSYANPDLAGVGVAFKLAWQLARTVCGRDRVDEPMRDFLLDATCLAALGTIADVVPLVGENRTIATFGLRGLPGTRHAGLRALLESAKLVGEKLDAYHVGFLLAPRLNAAGRMGHARLAVELLTSASADRSRAIADYLNKQNDERRKVERAIAAEAAQMVVDQGLDAPESRCIVLASENWHGGVIGIVASRLVEKFSRPTILVAFNGDGGQGSGRSIPGFHLRDALAACSGHVRSFGGHAMAAGLRIDRDRIEDFADAMAQYAAEHVPGDEFAAKLDIDAECSLAELSHNAVEHLGKLGPFGQGNPEPVVAVRNCRVLGKPKRMGRSGKTLGMLLGDGNVKMRAVGFGMGDLADTLEGVRTIDVAGTPGINSFQGRTSVEISLKDVTWE